jgi:beta-glucosidase
MARSTQRPARPRRPAGASRARLLAALTVQEKAGLCSGQDFWRLKAVPRLGIPALWLSDGPHGLRAQRADAAADHLGVNDARPAVCFPAGCAGAASFDRFVMTRLGDALGEECQAEGVDVLLGPAINIKRSPLGGRNFEYLSEDPYLTGQLASAYVRAVQARGVGVSLKHYAVNSQEHERLTISADVDERALREIYLAAFETVVREAHPWTVMSSYNRVNGRYVGEDHRLLTEVLRTEWGFDGVVVSDWGAVNDRVPALAAGLDLEMPGPGTSTDRQIAKAVRTGELPVAVLDRAVDRLLTLVGRCRPVAQPDPRPPYDEGAHHALATRLATECAVLLSNRDHLLPLAETARAVVIGEFARLPRYQGGGSSHVTPTRIVSTLDALAGAPTVAYEPGFPADRDERLEEWFDAAVAAARDAEVAIVCAGLPESFESEGYDRRHLRLPTVQNELIEAVAAVQPHTVVVLHNGSPVELPWADRVDAILEMYLGGQGVGQATVDLLYGRANPSGRLPESFPRRLVDNPSYINFPGHERVPYGEGVFVGYRYYDAKDIDVAFPFGHGLTYTSFAYGTPTCSSTDIRDTDTIEVEIPITNSGSRPGQEVVQLYVAPPAAAARPPRELKGFDKVDLGPGETGVARFTLGGRAFARWDEPAGRWVVDSGVYGLELGASSRDRRVRIDVHVTSTYRRPLIVTANTRVEELVEQPRVAALVRRLAAAVGGTGGGDGAAINDQMHEAALWQSPLRFLRNMSGVGQSDLDAIVDFLNARIGDRPGGPGQVRATLRILPALARLLRAR